MKSADEYGINQRYAYEADIEDKYGELDQSWEKEQELNEVAEHGYYLIQFSKNISNKIINEAGEVKIIDDVVIPKGQYTIEHITDESIEILATSNDDIYDNISKLISEKDASVNQTSTETITPTETKEVEVKEVTVADNNEPTMDLNAGLNIGKVRDRRKRKSGTKVNPKPTRLIPSRLTWGVWEGFVNDDSGPIDVDMSLKLLSKIYTEEQWNQLSDEEMEHELKCKGSFIAK